MDEALLRYLAIRDEQRMRAVNRAIETLRPFERRLVHEAAVMGFVRGTMHGRKTAVPGDAAIITEVISACISMSSLYPYLAEAAEGRRRRVTKARRWPGE